MQATALYGVGLTAERLEEIAMAAGAGCRSVSADLPAEERLDGAAVLVASLDDDRLGEILDRGAGICIEIGGLDVPDVAASVRLAQASSIFVSMTTASAYRLQLAHRIVHAIARRRPLEQDRCDDMELALQEAISNAVIHGNLSVHSLQDASLTALERFSAEVAERLTDPDLANRRLKVSVLLEESRITIDVVDQGPGFSPEPRRATVASGRGISLIETLVSGWELLDEGRRIRLRIEP
jgi:anti-sigma regulatory factor (Ser/Thr protein kinase)